MIKNKISDWIPSKKFTKKLLLVLMPVIIGSMLDNAVYFLDNFMATPLGEEGLAAVSAANEVIFSLATLAMGITFMADIFLAQYYGSKNREKVHETIRIKLYLVISIATIITIPLLISPQVFIFIFTIGKEAKGNFSSMAESYLRFMAIAQFIWMIGFVFLSSLTSIGKTKWTLYISLLSIIINFIFNYLFVFIFKIGINGLAFSTIISRSLEIVILTIAIRKNKYWVWPFITGVLFTSSLFKKIISKWMIMIGQFIWALGLAMQTVVWSNFYGPEILSGIGITYAVAGIAFTALPATSTAVRVVVGHELGQGNIQMAKKKSKMIFPIVMVMALVFTALMLIVAYVVPWAELIKGETTAERIIRGAGLTFSLLMPAYMLTAFSFSHLEIGGFTLMSTIFDRFSQLFIIVPFALLLAAFTDLDILIVFALTQATSIIIAFIAFPAYLRGKWARKLVEKDLDSKITRTINKKLE